jgi:PIN domain nuclease of toxin-antitoxin system
MVALTHAIAMRAENLPGFEARDPADRLLVASALVEGLTMATADRAMIEFHDLPTL